MSSVLPPFLGSIIINSLETRHLPPSFTVRDINQRGIVVSPTVLELTEAGAEAKVTVALTSRPTGSVTVHVGLGLPPLPGMYGGVPGFFTGCSVFAGCEL